MLPHHTQDEKEYIVPLIQEIRYRLRIGQSKKTIARELGKNFDQGEIYLAYKSAKLMEEYLKK